MTGAALEKNRITITALVLVLAAGVSAYFTLPQAEDPGFIIRTATVITHFPGASPERVENLVTDPIEEAVQEIPELDFVSSQSRTGVSIIFVNIRQQYREMRPVWDNLRRKVDRVKGSLPADIIGPTVNDEFGDVDGILYTLTGEGYSYAELKTVADEMRDALLDIGDVAKVNLYGVQDERIFVEYSNARLAELNLSAGQLKQILESRNIIIPGGSIQVGSERLVLEPSGNFETLEDLGRTVIQLPGRSNLAYLDDIVKISRGTVDPPSTRMRASGIPSLGIGVVMREGGNILTLGQQVAVVMGRLRTVYPYGIEVERVADQPARVERKVDEFAGNLLQAMAIVLVVMLVTLGLRTGLVVAALIPAAMLMTLMIMKLLGIGLDQMSLAALIIALGMLIDNAIVMSESIIVKMQDGTSAREAAIESGKELRVPLLTSSLTTAAAFLPIYLAKSQAGEYTGVIFEVVTITLLSSWLLALTMTPLLCVAFLKVKRRPGEGESYDTRFYRGYRSVLTALLRRRWVTLAGAVLVFVGGMQLFQFVPVLFFPKGDRNFFTAQFHLPSGTDISATEGMVDEIEQFMRNELASGPEREEGITTWATFIGGGEPRFILTFNPEEPLPSYAFMLINTTTFEAVAPAIARLDAFCNETFPDLVATIQPSEMGPPVEKPIQVRISAGDTETLFALATTVKEKMADIPGTRNIDDNWGRQTKKLAVAVNEVRARRAGVTSFDVAISLQSALSGITTTDFREEDEIIPVVLRSVEADRQDVGKLESLDVYSQSTGRSVPLTQVAEVQVLWEPSKIFRRDRSKTITVECNLIPGLTPTEVNAQLLPWLEEQLSAWPPATRYELGGEIESSGEANASISAQLPVALFIIVMLLVVQFNSLRRPLIILATIPLGMVGVVLGLLAFSSFLGFMTLLGVISLAGIVINNAIVLLDRIKMEIDENHRTPQEAILEASQRRLRPILLTTATTIGGLIPLYLGGGPMWEPMAVAIMCGLAFATTLTLGLVPVLYSIFFGVNFRAEPEES